MIGSLAVLLGVIVGALIGRPRVPIVLAPAIANVARPTTAELREAP